MRFTRRRGNGHSGQSNISNQSVSLFGKCIQSIHDCPLDRFETCLCDGDFTALILEGKPSKEKLAAIWATIYQDYADAVMGDTEVAITNYIRKISLLEFKITKTTAILELIATTEKLGETVDPEMYSMLIHVGAADGRKPEGDTLEASWYKRIAGRIKRWQGRLSLR
ncbi:hypothetical protein [Paraflavitalea speifideaquila]|uniref:hypothetical protein n=1 Tax=Paraflavitalea speifideaquila TaxID=3076558 RepID=UPI0028E74C24|nr:hypothetical protein [Paraflavitalea speifideiaquila]